MLPSLVMVSVSMHFNLVLVAMYLSLISSLLDMALVLSGSKLLSTTMDRTQLRKEKKTHIIAVHCR